ncbi:MAG: polysaccharide deacetylase family protein, partial [Synergistales bacterium]|nr:polysaccharide deacetylase family protein [Synergistales bacterium]
MRTPLPLYLARIASKSWLFPHLRVIYFHGVPQEFAGRFGEILDYFGQFFEYESYSRSLDLLSQATVQRPMMAVTFDDADRSVFDNALSIMETKRIKPCIFVVSDYVNKGYTYREKIHRPVMDWHMLRECVAKGMEIGNHTFSHPNLTKCSEGEILKELATNRQCIEDKLGVRVVNFAYPYGQFTKSTIDLVRRSGLCQSQATTQRGQMGIKHDLHFVRRDRIDLEKTPQQIETLMRLADRLYWI